MRKMLFIFILPLMFACEDEKNRENNGASIIYERFPFYSSFIPINFINGEYIFSELTKKSFPFPLKCDNLIYLDDNPPITCFEINDINSSQDKIIRFNQNIKDVTIRFLFDIKNTSVISNNKDIGISIRLWKYKNEDDKRPIAIQEVVPAISAGKSGTYKLEYTGNFEKGSLLSYTIKRISEEELEQMSFIVNNFDYFEVFSEIKPEN